VQPQSRHPRFEWSCPETQRQCAAHWESKQQMLQQQYSHLEVFQPQHQSWHPRVDWSHHLIQRWCAAHRESKQQTTQCHSVILGACQLQHPSQYSISKTVSVDPLINGEYSSNNPSSSWSDERIDSVDALYYWPVGIGSGKVTNGCIAENFNSSDQRYFLTTSAVFIAFRKVEALENSA
jgi:hypothetical protein